MHYVVCYNDRSSCKLDADDLDNRNEAAGSNRKVELSEEGLPLVSHAVIRRLCELGTFVGGAECDADVEAHRSRGASC